MKNDNRYYWVIFLMVALLLGMAFLVGGGFFDKKIPSETEKTAVSKNENRGDGNSNEKDELSEKTENANDKLKEADLLNTDMDIEADSSDTSDDELNDVGFADQDLDLDSVENDVY